VETIGSNKETREYGIKRSAIILGCSSHNTVRMIQSKGGKSTGHAARTAETGNAYNTLVGKAEKKKLLERT